MPDKKCPLFLFSYPADKHCTVGHCSYHMGENVGCMHSQLVNNNRDVENFLNKDGMEAGIPVLQKLSTPDQSIMQVSRVLLKLYSAVALMQRTVPFPENSLLCPNCGIRLEKCKGAVDTDCADRTNFGKILYNLIGRDMTRLDFVYYLWVATINHGVELPLSLRPSFSRLNFPKRCL